MNFIRKTIVYRLIDKLVLFMLSQWRKEHRRGLFVCAILLISISSFAQTYISKDATPSSLNWTAPATWTTKPGTTAPPVSLNSENVTIKGFVTLNGDLVLNGPGLLYVQDTLVINGNLSMNQTAATLLQVKSGGVLIIKGDYDSKNKVIVENGGAIVIGGTIKTMGSQADYNGEAGSAIYAVGGGGGYGLPTCSTPGPNCIGTGVHLSQTPVGQFFSSLTSSYSLGVNSTCFTNTGTPVILSYNPAPPANGAISNIKWFRDGASIHNWESVYSIQEYSAGNYSSSYTLTSDGKTYWAKGIAVLGGTGAITGNTSVLAGSVNIYSVGSVTNATSYQWTVPSGSVITSGQGTASITVTAGTQVGNIAVTPTNGSSSGCSSSLMVNIKDPTCDCSTTGAYWSKNNYTGLWSDANSWGNNTLPKPPPFNPNGSQSTCISGTITLNGNMTISTSNTYLCDTLIITGNLTISGGAFTVYPTGVLIVLGNMNITGGGSSLQGNTLVKGDFSVTGGGTTVSNTGNLITNGNFNMGNTGFTLGGKNNDNLYILNPSATVTTPPYATDICNYPRTSCYYDNLDSLLANESAGLIDLVNQYILTCNISVSAQPVLRTVCNGNNTSFSVTAGNAISYQWQVNAGTGFTNITVNSIYSGVTLPALSITGATLGMSGYIYRCQISNTSCNVNSASAMLTVNSSPAPITGILLVCAGSAITLGDITSGGTWSSATPAIATINSTGEVYGVAEGNSLISYTLSSGCAAAVTVTVEPLPNTGELYRKPNN